MLLTKRPVLLNPTRCFLLNMPRPPPPALLPLLPLVPHTKPHTPSAPLPHTKAFSPCPPAPEPNTAISSLNPTEPHPPEKNAESFRHKLAHPLRVGPSAVGRRQGSEPCALFADIGARTCTWPCTSSGYLDTPARPPRSPIRESQVGTEATLADRDRSHAPRHTLPDTGAE